MSYRISISETYISIYLCCLGFLFIISGFLKVNLGLFSKTSVTAMSD